MFNGIGFKIKFFAKVSFWVGVVLSIGSGLSNMIEGINNFDVSTAIGGFIILLLCPVFSWLCSIMLYGFGQLIENTGELVELKKTEIEGKKETE